MNVLLPAMGYQARQAQQGDVPTSRPCLQNVFLCRGQSAFPTRSGILNWPRLTASCYRASPASPATTAPWTQLQRYARPRWLGRSLRTVGRQRSLLAQGDVRAHFAAAAWPRDAPPECARGASRWRPTLVSADRPRQRRVGVLREKWLPTRGPHRRIRSPLSVGLFPGCRLVIVVHVFDGRSNDAALQRPDRCGRGHSNHVLLPVRNPHAERGVTREWLVDRRGILVA